MFVYMELSPIECNESYFQVKRIVVWVWVSIPYSPMEAYASVACILRPKEVSI